MTAEPVGTTAATLDPFLGLDRRLTAAVTRAAPAATPPRFFAAALAGFVTVRTVLPELSSAEDGLTGEPADVDAGKRGDLGPARRRAWHFAAFWRFGFLTGVLVGFGGVGSDRRGLGLVGGTVVFGVCRDRLLVRNSHVDKERDPQRRHPVELKDRASGRVVGGQLDRMLGADRDLLDADSGPAVAAAISVSGGVTAGPLSCAASGASAATLAPASASRALATTGFAATGGGRSAALASARSAR